MAAQNSDLKTLLSPKSVAITGASQNPEDIGSYVLRNIIFSNFKGRVFPVSATLNQLYNFDTYSSISDIAEEIDLLILASPADRVVDEVLEATKAKVKNICIISRGCFGESGISGLKLQKKIVSIANKAKIRVLGPNSLGIISNKVDLNASFAPFTPKKGNTAFISQSGSLINAFFDFCKFYDLGVSEVLGLGNKSDVSELDLLEFYASLNTTDQPSVVGAYLENIANGTDFIDTCSKLCKNTPVVALIPSESQKAREYIYSHTGSIVQNDEVINLGLKQGGVIRAYTQEQLYDLMLVFSWQVLPKGGNVAIVSNAEGGLIIGIDDVYRYGLKLVNFSQDIKDSLSKVIDWRGHGAGVVDLGGDAQSLNYLKALDVVLSDSEVNAVIVILSPQIMTQIDDTAEAIGKLAKDHKKTVICAFMGYAEVEKGIKTLSKYFVPAFNSVERAVFVLSQMYQYSKWKNFGGKVLSKFSYFKPFEKQRSSKVLEKIERARVTRKLNLELDETLSILKSYEIDTGLIKQIENQDELVEFVKSKGFPSEVVCVSRKKRAIVRSESEAKRIFTELCSGKKCKGDLFVKALRLNKKIFTVNITKDTYYEHMDKGYTVKDLAKLSFGYLFHMSFDAREVSDAISVLIPVTREGLEQDILNSRFLEEVDIKSEQFDEVRNNLIGFVQRAIRIPMDFSQIGSVELKCVIKEVNVSVVDCEVRLDLVA